MSAAISAETIVARFEEYYPVLDFVTRTNAGPAVVCKYYQDGIGAPHDKNTFGGLPEWEPIDKVFQAYVEKYYPNWTGQALSAYEIGLWPTHVEMEPGSNAVAAIGLPAAATYLTRGDSLARYWLAMGDKHGFGERLRTLVTALQAIDTILDKVQARSTVTCCSKYIWLDALRPVFDELHQSGYSTIGPFYIEWESEPKNALTADEHQQLVELLKAAEQASCGA